MRHFLTFPEPIQQPRLFVELEVPTVGPHTLTLGVNNACNFMVKLIEGSIVSTIGRHYVITLGEKLIHTLTSSSLLHFNSLSEIIMAIVRNLQSLIGGDNSRAYKFQAPTNRSTYLRGLPSMQLFHNQVFGSDRRFEGVKC